MLDFKKMDPAIPVIAPANGPPTKVPRRPFPVIPSTPVIPPTEAPPTNLALCSFTKSWIFLLISPPRRFPSSSFFPNNISWNFSDFDKNPVALPKIAPANGPPIKFPKIPPKEAPSPPPTIPPVIVDGSLSLNFSVKLVVNFFFSPSSIGFPRNASFQPIIPSVKMLPILLIIPCPSRFPSAFFSPKNLVNTPSLISRPIDLRFERTVSSPSLPVPTIASLNGRKIVVLILSMISLL